jgi:dipeptidyl aminopeptidase/acylaminoacyl peptidase
MKRLGADRRRYRVVQRDKNVTKVIASQILFFGIWLGFAYGQSHRSITPADCVSTRYLLPDFYHPPLRFDRQGTRIAYVVKSPSLKANENVIQLYVQDVPSLRGHAPRLLFSGLDVAQPEWSADGGHISFLAKQKGHIAIEQVDLKSGESRVIQAAKDADITEYNLSRDGRVMVFATNASSEEEKRKPDPTQIANGYRIIWENPSTSTFSRRLLFISKRQQDGQWSKEQALSFISPFSGATISKFPNEGGVLPALSPDGQLLLFTFNTEGVPQDWEKSPMVRRLRSVGYPPRVLILYDLKTRKASIPIQSPEIVGPPLWDEKGDSFIVPAVAPVNTQWETDGGAAGELQRHDLFIVDASDHSIQLIRSGVSTNEAPLFWRANGNIIIHVAGNRLEELSWTQDGWKVEDEIEIPLPDFDTFGYLATNGDYIVGGYDNPSTPPEIFAYKRGTEHAALLAKLNPQFEQLRLAVASPIIWHMPDGYRIDGLLFVPPDYQPGTKYPLVIQTKPLGGGFVCDSGVAHYPAFEPQPMATSGIAYLSRTLPAGFSYDDDEKHYPKRYPGRVGEAAFHMEMWEAAIDALDSAGRVDPRRIGIIGFSRAGWYTEFILSHSRVHYAAATVDDNVQYSYGEYWLRNWAGVEDDFDHMYGGPPWGETFENWKQYSISFNLDKIRTPILMEEMGEGVPFTDDKAPPASLSRQMEVFAGLNRLHRPVEVFYYPNEQHQPDDPQARLASLQRNLDWFRFWLQGHEDPDAAKAEQFERWRRLQQLQQEQEEKDKLGHAVTLH